MRSSLIVGVDASRNRSGGAIAHVKGLMRGSDPRLFGIAVVHFWAHDALLDEVDDAPWLVKHSVAATRGPLLVQMAWQRYFLPREARGIGVAVMFNTDAGSVCPFQPSLTLSQDMLSFEPGEMQRYPWSSWSRLRLEVLRSIQLHRLRRSSISLFLTEHARRVIGGLASLSDARVIPHGIDERFLNATRVRRPLGSSEVIRCLYVSNAAPYKHQWHVVEAVGRLRARLGRDLRLRLVGGGSGLSLRRLQDAIRTHDPDGVFVEQLAFVPNERIVGELTAADLFIFASSCESLPITLLEAMATAIPIASSDRGPMPEVLGHGGCYFDPESPESIAVAIERLVTDSAESERIAETARERAETYCWSKCASDTWRILASAASRVMQNRSTRRQRGCPD